MVADPDPKVGGEIVAAREKHNQPWSEIAAAQGMSIGKAMMIYMQMTAEKFDQSSEAKLKTAVAKARNNGESWGLIIAKSGRTEGWCRRVWEEKTGEQALGHRIGKGGQYPKGAERPDPAEKPAPKKAAAKKAPAKKAAKKAPAKKAAASKAAPSKLADMTLEQLQERLDGKTITLVDGEKITVDKITNLRDGEIVFKDGEGTVLGKQLAEIKSASRK
jgi:hypothetical protein